MKESVLFDMKSETCLLLLVVIVWKCEYFIFLAKCFLLLYALGFHACIFWPLGWLWLKTILSVSDFLETFPCNSSLPDFRLKRAGQLNGWVPLVHLDWYHFKWKWNSSSTLRKWQIIENVKCKTGKRRLTCFYNFFIL